MTLVLAVGFAVAGAGVVESWRKRAASASQTDWLTGALTPEDFTRRLKELCALHARDLAPFSLVMFDIDRFRRAKEEQAHFGRIGASSTRLEPQATRFSDRLGTSVSAGKFERGQGSGGLHPRGALGCR